MKTHTVTPRQQLVLDAITSSVRLTGRPPTLRELGDRLGIASTNAVRDHLQALQDKGFITRDGRSARGIRLVGAGEAPAVPEPPVATRPARPARLVPVLGRVAAGTPLFAEQSVDSYLTVDGDLVRDGNVFALRVKGDSMRDAGILDGDFVFVRQQANASPRDIVVALLGEETTVKRYVPAGDQVRLEPENPAHQPIVVSRSDSRFAILGKVCAVLRTI